MGFWPLSPNMSSAIPDMAGADDPSPRKEDSNNVAVRNMTTGDTRAFVTNRNLSNHGSKFMFDGLIRSLALTDGQETILASPKSPHAPDDYEFLNGRTLDRMVERAAGRLLEQGIMALMVLFPPRLPLQTHCLQATAHQLPSSRRDIRGIRPLLSHHHRRAHTVSNYAPPALASAPSSHQRFDLSSRKYLRLHVRTGDWLGRRPYHMDVDTPAR